MYFVFAAITTLPLPVGARDRLLGLGGDGVQYVWNLWWVRYALEHRVNPFEPSLVFWPVGARLYIGTTAVVDALATLPLQWLVGPVVTYNVLLLAKLALSAFAAYLLAAYVWRDRWAAVLAGIAYGFCAYLAAHALGHMGLLSVMFMPLAVLWLCRAAAGDGRRYGLLAALALALNVPTLHYALYLALFALLFLVWQTVRLRRTPRTLACVWARSLATGALTLALAAPLVVLLLLQGERTVGDPKLAYAYGADLLAYLVPSAFHPVFGPLVGDLTRRITKFDNLAEALVFPGYTVLALAVGALIWSRRGKAPVSPDRPLDLGPAFWAYIALCFGVLSLGLELRVGGQYTGVPLPYALLNHLPLWDTQNAPSRFAIMAQMALAVLAAGGLRLLRLQLTVVGRRRATRLAAVLASALVAFESLWVPYPTFPLPPPAPFYAQLAADPARYAVLNVPYNARPDREAWDQIAHQKPQIGGYVTRPGLDYLPNRMLPPFQDLTLYWPPFPDDLVPFDLAGDGLAVLRSFDVHYLLVHRDLLTPSYAQITADLLQTLGFGPPVYEDERLAAYVVPPAAGPERLVAITRWLLPTSRPAPYEPPARTADGALYRETVGGRATLGLWATQATRATLALPVWSSGEPTTLTLTLNEVPIAEQPLDGTRQVFAVPLDLRQGSNLLTLHGNVAVGPLRLTLE